MKVFLKGLKSQCKAAAIFIMMSFAVLVLLCSFTGASGVKHGKIIAIRTAVAAGNGNMRPVTPKIKKPGALYQLSVPTLSYGGPQTYLAGAAITPLTPTSTGVSAAGYSSSATVLGSGFSIPGGVAVDKAGNIYVADGGNNAVKRIPAGGGSPVIVGSGFSNPTAVAIDAAGNLYIADYGNNAVKEIPAGLNTIVTLGSGFSHPYGVAVDATGDVFVADNGNNAVKEILPTQLTPVTVGSGFIGPEGVAVDAAGNVYVADTGNGVVKKIPVGGGAPVNIGSGFNNPTGVGTDASGNLFVADAGNNAIKEILVGGTTPINIGSGLNSPAGTAIDGYGNLFVADQLNNAVKEISPAGGYYISAALPLGLSFSNSTGVISGNPAKQIAPTNYIITAYNSTGNASATIGITVNALTISYSGALTLTAGSAISPITPASAGVALPAYSNNFTQIGSGFNHPFGVALDTHGNTFIADGDNYEVKEIRAGSDTSTVVFTGDGTITGVAVDLNGNLFIPGATNLTDIEELPAGGGTATTVGSGFNLPYGAVTDAPGNLYVTDEGDGAVKEVLIKAATNTTVTVATGFNNPTSIAMDAYGNLFVADENNNAVKEISIYGGAPVTIGSGFSLPTGVAVDNSGNVFVADYNNSALKEIPSGVGNPITLSGGFSTPVGVTVDAADNLYVSDYGHNLVKKISPAGGYYITPALPLGLTFNTTTGAISGTPMAQSVATNYTITAYNMAGSNYANIIIKVNLPAVPVISYSSPQNYLIGTAITPLAPSGSGVAPPGYSRSFVNIATGDVYPFGVALDAAGNLYVTDESLTFIKELPVAGGNPIIVGTGLSGPSGIAIDAKGDIYLADINENLVREIPHGGGPAIVIGSGFSVPIGVAVDVAGNVYIADKGNNSVKKIIAGTNTQVTIATGFSGINAIAVDLSGNVYLATAINTNITKIPANGGTPVNIAFGGIDASAITIDAAGNIYVTDAANGTVSKIPVSGGSPVILATGLNLPQGIAIDPSGNLYVANTNSPSVVEIKPIGGFYINSPLPTGLNFNSNTGTITGTPTASSAAQNYAVTGYNLGGGGTAIVNIKTSPLTLSYASPQSYTVNVPITPLLPTYSGLATAGYGTSPSALAVEFSTPLGVAVDATGNVYVADAGTRNISQIPIAGGASVIEGSGFTVPYGVAVDAAGNMYVTDNSANNVKKIPYNGGTPVIIGAGFNGPNGVAVDASGNVYVGDAGSGTVKKIPAGGGAVITIASGFNYPAGVAVDSTGNVYVADQLNSAIKMIPAGGGTPVTLGSGFHQPTGVAVDGSGNVFVADQLNNAIKEIPAGGGAVVTIGSGFNQPYGVCVDGAGVVYVGDTGTGTVKKITPVGGFYINAMPIGLAFSNVSGGFSGTPKVISPATNYTVTAYNSVGNNFAVVNIKITPPAVAFLSGLVLSSGALAPVFSSGTNGYAAAVGNAISSITLTPTTTDPLATVKVNGTAVATGAASAALPLVVGQNVITTVVTAQDGITTDTYSVTITRAASSNANISSLKISAGSLSPAFASGTTSYADNVANGVSFITVTPTNPDPMATITVNGLAVTSGSASPGLPLVVGPNTITIVVTAGNGVTTKTYTVIATEAKSSNANLAGLKPGTGAISPVFAPATTNYTETVNYAVSSISITPTTAVSTATVTVNGTAVASGTASAPISLGVGANVISTVVTAQDGVTFTKYTLTITRSAALKNAQLSALALSSGVLSPAFVPTTIGYTASEVNGVALITITPSTADVNATVTVNGVAVTSGSTSQNLPLVVGANTITVVVTAQDGTTKKTYTTTVTEAPSTNANLANIVLSNGVLSPAFSKGTTSYTDNVGNGLASMTITPTAGDPAQTITVNGTAVTSGSASQSLPLVVGPNTITVVATAQDGVTSKTYTIVVTEAQSTNDNLLALKPNTGSMSPVFSPATTTYTESVSNTISRITITPTTVVSSATITVNGTAVLSGTVSGPINLAVGANVITTIVTAQSGVTKTYTLTVTRAASGADSYVPIAIGTGISVSKPSELPAIVDDGILVHQGVSPNGDGINDFLQIDNISQYPDNKLSIMNRNGQLIYETKGYDNNAKVFDGHSNKNGQMQLPGTYFYQLDYTVSGITKHKTGFIVLKY